MLASKDYCPIRNYNQELVAICKISVRLSPKNIISIGQDKAISAPELVSEFASRLKMDFSSADILFQDLKKFLLTAAVSGSDLVPTKKLDSALHVLLEHSICNQFCEQLLGSEFYHSDLSQDEVEDSVMKTIGVLDSYGLRDCGNFKYI